MVKISIHTFLLSLLWLLSFCIRGLLADVDPGQYVLAATNFRDGAQSGLNQGNQLCLDSGCDDTFRAQLDSLQAAINSLNALLVQNPPPVDSIRASINNIAPMLQNICTTLGVQCPVPPAGAVTDDELSNLVLQLPDPIRDLRDYIPDPPPSCAQPASYNECVTCAQATRDACLQGFNRWVNCRMRTPYCDWRGSPFDDFTFHRDCQDLITAGDVLDCRCTCPQTERQGGCPQFFQSPPPGSFDACRPSCSFQVCARGDTRCSCTGSNQFNCDLCQYEKATLIAAAWKRANICEKRFTEDMLRCNRPCGTPNDRCWPGEGLVPCPNCTFTYSLVCGMDCQTHLMSCPGICFDPPCGC